MSVFRLNRLALKIACGVAVLVVALGVSLALLTDLPLWTAPVHAVAAAAAVYLVARRLLADRIELARSTLKQIRKHEFGNLEAAHIPKGDELNALIWQVYRTGLALEKEIGELKKMENYRREFLGNVSHELKTPIFAIQGFAETLLDGGLQDEGYNRSFVEKILRNASRLSHLAQDLTEISKIETGELQMTMAPFDLGRVIGEVCESLEPLAVSKTVRLQARVEDGLPFVAGDRERIRQVLINLVENAIKYNSSGGYVEVVAQVVESDEVHLSVIDDGLGVAPQDLPRLTERFFRVDKSRSRSQGGTGLGLAIVKHILNAHGRQLQIESRLGEGSTFGFSLPTVAPQERHLLRREERAYG